MAICVGDEFTVDPTGKLKLKLCGSPADVEPCASTENLIKRSATCGLHAPRSRIISSQGFETTLYPNLVVPAAPTLIKSFSLDVVNPDPCRPAVLNIEEEVDVNVDLPAGGRAAFQIGTNEHHQFDNRGTSTVANTHTTGTKVFWNVATIPAGGTQTVTLDVSLRDGAGNATYNRIETVIRAQLLIV